MFCTLCCTVCCDCSSAPTTLLHQTRTFLLSTHKCNFSHTPGRGVDFLGINTVVNYDMPASRTDYIHRIGRTGRGGRRGTAITLFVEQDAPKLRGIATLIKASGSEVCGGVDLHSCLNAHGIPRAARLLCGRSGPYQVCNISAKACCSPCMMDVLCQKPWDTQVPDWLLLLPKVAKRKRRARVDLVGEE